MIKLQLKGKSNFSGYKKKEGTKYSFMQVTGQGNKAETVDDMVNFLRKKFDFIGIITPGTAKSAGTIFTMAADEILMGTTSALGLIEAQRLQNNILNQMCILIPIVVLILL